MPWTPPEDEQVPLNTGWTPPADEAEKPGPMAIFPKMLKEASTMGMPNMAQAMTGDIVGADDTQTAPIGDPLKTNVDKAGLQDVSIPDAATAYGALSGLGEASGVSGTMGKYAKRFGQNQAIKALGASGGQIGQVGIPESREIAQMVIDKGAVSPLRGPIGMEEYVDKLHKGIGADIGGFRKEMGTLGDAPQMPEILDRVNKDLTAKYASGTEKAPATLNRAKEQIAKGGTGTFLGNAQKATDLNTAASANKIYRPQGATTDVADTITQMNEEKMKGLATPEKWTKYQKDLSEYGPLSTVKEFLKRGERKEMTGRGGSSLIKTAADKTMDAMGNRTAATLGSKLGDVLLSPTKGFDAAALANYLVQKYGGQVNAD